MTFQIGTKLKSAAAVAAFSGAALTMATSGALAKDTKVATPTTESGSPEAGTAEAIQPATPANGANAIDKARLSESIQQLTDAITAVQQDRDAVASQIDVTEIDLLLAKATELRDAATATLQSDDVSTAPQSIVNGLQTAQAAQGLIEAGVSDYGLPSQQSRTSRVLVQAYYAIDEALSTTAGSTDTNAAFFSDSAKRLYGAAYELYNSGVYAQAERTAAVAQQVAMIGSTKVSISTFDSAAPGMTVEGGAVDVQPGTKAEPGFSVNGGKSFPADVPPAESTTPGAPRSRVVELTPFDGGEASGTIVGPNFAVVLPGVPFGRMGPVEGGQDGGFVVSGGPELIPGADTSTPLEVPAPNFD